MKLIKAFLNNNPCYTEGRTITVKGLMLHSVGCPQPDASVFIRSWNRSDFDSACVHGFIDARNGTVYQTLPWNHRAWHAGAGTNGSANNTHIGIEMCEPKAITYTDGASFVCRNISSAQDHAVRTYNAAVELFAELCILYNLNPTTEGVIISHKEGHASGIASDHSDPEHLWEGLDLPYTMDTFRKDVESMINRIPARSVQI